MKFGKFHRFFDFQLKWYMVDNLRMNLIKIYKIIIIKHLIKYLFKNLIIVLIEFENIKLNIIL